MSIKPKQLLETCIKVLDERGKQRDNSEGERSMQKIIELFYFRTGVQISVQEGWIFMQCLKQVRMKTGLPDIDNFIDLINYIALEAESVEF